MELTQPEESVTSKDTLPAMSQIPGLCDVEEDPNELPSGCHRRWIRETDSAYVKLSKQGGQPDLLKHCAHVATESSQSTYAAPDWYSHRPNAPATGEPRSYVSSLPDYMVHKEFNASDYHGDAYESKRGPFDFDMKSVWQRDADDKEDAEKKKISLMQAKLPAVNPEYSSKMPNVSTDKEFSGENKISSPAGSTQRKGEAVNFSKLISNGYGTDWFEQHSGQENKVQETSQNSEQSEDSEASQLESAPASN
ncbi:uncharacterized protein C7orf57 homolog isoform X1 [Heliangelus exortis]|uniref:uncharacterized protein C7orf57 homolog isoform X1 n=1 Tax=Heliangelus exortis TaxID=472823 RepID=UPI003A903A0F